MTDKHLTEFQKAAEERRSRTLLGEFWEFMRENRNWWLLPIVLALLVLGLVLLLSGTAAAPFIYTLF